LVGTETLINGTRDVEVAVAVGEDVADGEAEGVKVARGGTGVNVGQGVGDTTVADGGTTAAAVCVAPEAMVAMIAVPRKLASCVGAGRFGVAQARETRKRTVIDTRIGAGFRIVPPFGHPVAISPKERNDPLTLWTLTSRYLFPIHGLYSKTPDSLFRCPSCCILRTA